MGPNAKMGRNGKNPSHKYHGRKIEICVVRSTCMLEWTWSTTLSVLTSRAVTAAIATTSPISLEAVYGIPQGYLSLHLPKRDGMYSQDVSGSGTRSFRSQYWPVMSTTWIFDFDLRFAKNVDKSNWSNLSKNWVAFILMSPSCEIKNRRWIFCWFASCSYYRTPLLFGAWRWCAFQI